MALQITILNEATIELSLGVPGPAATIQVGTTTTGQAGTDALVVNSGTISGAIFDFTIPRGDKGDKGDQGIQGQTGQAATISVGSTNTLSAGSSATVTNSGTSSAAVFNFGIPQGVQGEKGDKGDTGAGGVWGQITGTISNQTDLQEILDAKLNLSGGTMTNSAVVVFPQNSNAVDSEIGSWGFGVEKVSEGKDSYIDQTGIYVQDSNASKSISINASGITFTSGTPQTTAWIDAPSDDVTYGRKNGEWVSGGNPADGFTLNTEAIIDTTAGTINAGNIIFNNSLLTGTIQNSALVFDSNNIAFGNNTFVFGSNNFNFGGNTFNFSSDTMSGSITPNNLSIGNAVFNGTEFISAWTGGYLFYSNGIIGAANGDGGYAAWLNYYGNGGLQITGGGGITFADNTYQDTAPISPANGFTLSIGSSIDTTAGTIIAGNITFNNSVITGNIAAPSLNIASGSQITLDGVILTGVIAFSGQFAIQANSYLSFSDNSTQYTKGDRYKTTSTSSNTINNGNGKSFICDPYLAYTPLQTCIIYSESNPSGLHMHCDVVSYDQVTGELIVDVNTHTGSGTHTDWVINK